MSGHDRLVCDDVNSASNRECYVVDHVRRWRTAGAAVPPTLLVRRRTEPTPKVADLPRLRRNVALALPISGPVPRLPCVHVDGVAECRGVSRRADAQDRNALSAADVTLSMNSLLASAYASRPATVDASNLPASSRFRRAYSSATSEWVRR